MVTPPSLCTSVLDPEMFTCSAEVAPVMSWSRPTLSQHSMRMRAGRRFCFGPQVTGTRRSTSVTLRMFGQSDRWTVTTPRVRVMNPLMESPGWDGSIRPCA